MLGKWSTAKLPSPAFHFPFPKPKGEKELLPTTKSILQWPLLRKDCSGANPCHSVSKGCSRLAAVRWLAEVRAGHCEAEQSGCC